jgi:hypothetical protein
MFELYDSLLLQATTGRSAAPDLERLRADIVTLDTEGQNYIYALIYYHNQVSHLATPKLAERVPIDLCALPKVLLKVLGRFVLMHRKRMEEQAAMNEAISTIARKPVN